MVAFCAIICSWLEKIDVLSASGCFIKLDIINLSKRALSISVSTYKQQQICRVKRTGYYLIFRPGFPRFIRHNMTDSKKVHLLLYPPARSKHSDIFDTIIAWFIQIRCILVSNGYSEITISRKCHSPLYRYHR